MIGITRTICTYGCETFPVRVEADLLAGTIGMQIVGLGDNAIKESRERIRSAIHNAGFSFPVKYIVVNLAPNERPKEAAISELAICTAILIASGQLPQEFFNDKILLGSVSLDGSLQQPLGMMAGLIAAKRMKAHGGVILPASLTEIPVPQLKVYPLGHLSGIRDLARGTIPFRTSPSLISPITEPEINMSDIMGLEFAKQGIAYAAAGRHHAIMIGAPGTGKTMLSRAMKNLGPEMNIQEILSTSQIYSSARLLTDKLVIDRPFRNPHHTTSDIAMVGGGSKPMPGEVSLAHNGVLFLDELMEFRSSVLQALREPMEDRKITISRASGTISFPAAFQLLGATNPCRCGYLYSTAQKCTCSRLQIENLYRKIIGPFLDRISIEIETPEATQTSSDTDPRDTAWWKNKIKESCNRMYHRNGGTPNAHLATVKLMEYYRQSKMDSIIKNYLDRLPLSNRGLVNTLRLGLTIMDFHEDNKIREEYIDEAFAYRVIFHLRQNYLQNCA